MYPDLTARLRQDIRKLNRDELYFVRDYSLVDGSFLLYHFISSYLRSPDGLVYVLALNHPIAHYKIVLAKVGVQLQRQIDQNRCRFLDFSQLLSMNDESIKNEAPWFRFGGGNRSSVNDPNSQDAEEAMKMLYLQIKNEIEIISKGTSTTDGNHPPLLIVIDSLSALLDFQIPLNHVVQFLRYLRNLGKQFGASFAILSKTDEEFRPEICDDSIISAYDRLATYVSDWGSGSFEKTVIFDVKPLATGWSQDVHGEVTIRQSRPLDSEEIDKESPGAETRLLFKLGDRNVTFMAPGLVPRIGV